MLFLRTLVNFVIYILILRTMKGGRECNLPSMMSIQQVSSLLNVTYHTVFKWIQLGELPAVRLGSKIWRVPKESLLDFIKEDNR